MDVIVTPQLGAGPGTRPRFDAGIAAVALAGVCTFLDVYTTQALLPYLRQVYHASEVEVSLTVSATILATAFAAPIVGLLAEAIGRGVGARAVEVVQIRVHAREEFHPRSELGLVQRLRPCVPNGTFRIQSQPCAGD